MPFGFSFCEVKVSEKISLQRNRINQFNPKYSIQYPSTKDTESNTLIIYDYLAQTMHLKKYID